MKTTASILASLLLLCTIQAGVSRSLLNDGLKHHLNKREELGNTDADEQAPRVVVPFGVLPAISAPGVASPAPTTPAPDTLTQMRINKLIEDITNNVTQQQNILTK